MTDTDIRHTGETQEDYSFMLLKTEKLSIAVHAVTNHLFPHEPLREDFRRAALGLVKDIRALVCNEGGEIVSDTSFLRNKVEEAISYLYIAKNIEMISPGNALILEREYLALKDFFTHNKVEYFTKNSRHDLSSKVNISSAPIGHPEKRGTTETLKMVKKGPLARSPDGLSRREMILNIIEGRNSYSLGDIVSRIKGVSEKTIQRDLLDLVGNKILKKTGERRWSRYSRV